MPRMAIDEALRARREQVVREHMQSENEMRFDDTLKTFKHPRYEMIPSGDVFDGEAEVREYYRISRSRTPDQNNEIIALHFADEAVIVEFWLRGTTGGKPFECRMCAFFMFDGELITNEVVYYDRKTIFDQVDG
jgi:ketosteroid isomerase-like protein